VQRECRFPRRCFVGHPFNPPHLIPLVELVGGSGTDPEVLGWAQDFYREIRRHPVRLQREVYGHIANRLQYVLFNEAARLVLEGVASVEDVDAAVAHGPGMRWAFFGPFMTMHLAGGTSGMTGAFQKFSGRDSTSDDRARRLPLTPEERQTLIDGVQVELKIIAEVVASAQDQEPIARLGVALLPDRRHDERRPQMLMMIDPQTADRPRNGRRSRQHRMPRHSRGHQAAHESKDHDDRKTVRHAISPAVVHISVKT